MFVKLLIGLFSYNQLFYNSSLRNAKTYDNFIYTKSFLGIVFKVWKSQDSQRLIIVYVLETIQNDFSLFTEPEVYKRKDWGFNWEFAFVHMGFNH